MPVDLFTYGTLMVPEVMRELTNQVFDSEPAVADGYVRFRVHDRIYPGIMPQLDHNTPGYLYRQLDERSLDLLDWFEDDFYARESIAVRCGDQPPCLVHAYVMRPEAVHLLTDEPWQLEHFVQHHLDSYIAKCRRLREEYLAEKA